jgi:hypothetical protein
VKRLFALRNTSNGELSTEFFSSKPNAKRRRDTLNGGTPVELKEQDKPVLWVVTNGPDHRHFE